MLEFWLVSENLFFTISLLLMSLLVVFQVIGLGELLGDADIEMPDPDIDGDLAGAGDGLLGILGFGKVPLMILLMLMLGLFGMIGLSGQMVLQNLTGSMLRPWLAVPLAAFASLPLTGAIARPLAKILPRDETTAVGRDTLVGRFATIELGKAESGSPARAKVRDVHGQSHFVMVEPDNAGQILEQGEEILLVRRDDDIFRAISRGQNTLPRL
ncbi:YqiJ family protein [Parasphingorhabdus sp. DH2-15]|uniref:YqiJ family protein n=1 Tax=Parasphingorhabdus sp. DH2-15 TaxID=3444112 RepID=UPI003F686F00